MQHGFSFHNHRKRKYDRGISACGECRLGNHKGCRPLLDGALCTCACRGAKNIREEVTLLHELAAERGQVKPSVEECVKVFRPRYRQLF